MDITFSGVIKEVLPVEVDTRNNPPKPFKRYRYIVEEVGEQYPDSIAVGIFDKDGTGEVLANIENQFGSKLAVGVCGNFHIHIRGSKWEKPNTGVTSMFNEVRCWKIEQFAFSSPNPQPFANAPQQPIAPSFQQPGFQQQPNFQQPQPNFQQQQFQPNQGFQQQPSFQQQQFQQPFQGQPLDGNPPF